MAPTGAPSWRQLRHLRGDYSYQAQYHVATPTIVYGEYDYVSAAVLLAAAVALLVASQLWFRRVDVD